MSWDELKNIGREPTQDEKELAERERKGILQDFAATFATDTGRRVLKHLRNRTIERPTFVAPAPGADGLAMQKGQDLREGENNLVREIESLVKQAGVKL